MLTYTEALAKILAQATPLPTAHRPLIDLLGHVLAEPVIAPFPMPRFDNSAVDGYGVLLEDVDAAAENVPIALKLTGEIAAGAKGDLTLSRGEAIKILTGAVVPTSVQAVVMREYCCETNGSVSIAYRPESGENIRRLGAEFPEGKQILDAGYRVTPPVVGLLASLGYAKFAVHEKPRVAVITTGDELVEPGQQLEPGKIYNSNSYALNAALIAIGIDKIDMSHAKDSAEDTRSAFSRALKSADVVISTGGVSVGDYDYVKDALEELGVETIFWKIAIKPGKPVYFGVVNSAEAPRKLIFGLPGNPVSGLVTYHQFVKPALLKLMGLDTGRAQRNSAVLRSTLKKKPGRLDFVRAITSCSEDGTLEVRATTGQDSHMISGLAKANSLIHFDADAGLLESGCHAQIDWLSWSD